jgi:transketolase
MNEDQLKSLAKEIRQDIFHMISNKGGGHYGGSLSSVEILVSLYHSAMLPNDRFILSKAHAGAALYSVLASKKIIDKNLLKTYCQEGSVLGVHPESDLLPQIEFSSGSLGHGLSFSIGLALGFRKQEKPNNVYCLIGDGESQEGSVWEAALFASHHKLSNIIAITDYNKKQASGLVDDILGLEILAEKWIAFGWNVLEVDGHSFKELCSSISFAKKNKDKPTMIIANTVKGKGITYLENSETCHHTKFSEEQNNIALQELL